MAEILFKQGQNITFSILSTNSLKAQKSITLHHVRKNDEGEVLLGRPYISISRNKREIDRFKHERKLILVVENDVYLLHMHSCIDGWNEL